MVQKKLNQYFLELQLKNTLSSCLFLNLSCVAITHRSVKSSLQPVMANRKFYFTFTTFHQLSLSFFKSLKYYKIITQTFSQSLIPAKVLVRIYSFYFIPVILSWGNFYPYGIFEIKEDILVVTLGRGCYWHLVGRIPGCC